jgi:hypothetical protein
MVVRPNHLFCKKHWDFVPKKLQERLLAATRVFLATGISVEYQITGLKAINAVEQAETSARAEASTLHPQSSSQEPADPDIGSCGGDS